MSTSPFVEAFQKLIYLLDNKPKLNAKIEREFPKAKDDSERVALVAPLLRMLDFSPISTTPEKSENTSSKLREIGNDFYSKGNYTQALENYNASISVAPTDSTSKSLALAFANRSVTLKAVGQYKHSIGDCLRALELGYPEELQYKIYLRLGQCYKLLNLLEEAVKNLKKSKEMLAKSSVVEPKLSLLNTQLEDNIKELEVARRVQVLNLGEDTKLSLDDIDDCNEVINNVTVRSKPSNELPAASDCVRLVHNPRFGRHLVAAADINPGDVLIVEKPYTAVLFPEVKLSHCYHCFKQYAALLPCPTCSQAMFCSETCKDEAWKKYHEFECPILTSVMNFNPGSITLLTVRIFALVGIKKLSAFLENPPPKKSQCPNQRTFDFNEKSQLDSSKFLHIYYLETGEVSRPYLEKLGRSLVANYLLQILKLDTLPNFDKLGSFLMKISQSLSLHGFEFHEINASKNGMFKKVKIGNGIFPTVSMLNHSCDPDVIHSYNGSTAVVVATKPIAKGAQIFSYYRTNFLKEECYQRQSYLEKNYFFNCMCIACIKKYPMRFRLPALIPVETQVELSEAHNIYKANLKNFTSIQLISKEHLPILVNLIKVFDKNGKRLTSEYCVCQDAIKMYFWKQGNYYINF